MRQILPFLVLSSACGSAGVTPITDVSAAPNTYAVETDGDLPVCSEARQDQMFFVEADRSFRVCRDTVWVPIDVRGPAGASGKDGSNGKDGAAGKDATAAGLFAASIHCGGQLATTPIWFSYSAAVLKSGDVLAQGSIRDGYFEISTTSFYSRDQVGAASASVIFQDDLQGTANGGWWTIELDRTSLVTTILYQDSDAPGGSTTWTMAADKCIANVYQ